MSSERAGAPTHGALNREKAISVLLRAGFDSWIAAGVLNALEECVVPDPRIARIEALLERPDTSHNHLVTVEGVRRILRGDE